MVICHDVDCANGRSLMPSSKLQVSDNEVVVSCPKTVKNISLVRFDISDHFGERVDLL